MAAWIVVWVPEPSRATTASESLVTTACAEMLKNPNSRMMLRRLMNKESCENGGSLLWHGVAGLEAGGRDDVHVLHADVSGMFDNFG